jgi:hypothetical protein
MHTLINAAFSRRRTVILLLLLLLSAGMISYVSIPKQAAPDIEIPFFNISVVYSGVSAEDSARLVVQPLERRLQGLDGLRQMTAHADEGFANILLEFDPGVDNQRALTDVRDQVDLTRPELPADAEEPVGSCLPEIQEDGRDLGLGQRQLADEALQVLDPCDFEPHDERRVVRDPLRVRLREADPDLGRERKEAHRRNPKIARWVLPS